MSAAEETESTANPYPQSNASAVRIKGMRSTCSILAPGQASSATANRQAAQFPCLGMLQAHFSRTLLME
jgi:hypothetical protein